MDNTKYIYIICIAVIAVAAVIIMINIFRTGAGTSSEDGYIHITQEEAAEMMKSDDGHIIVDVRTHDEYRSGHIPGAVCIPVESIGSEQPDELPDLDQVILIYCRSGRRSKTAAGKLVSIGYTNIYEFGGITDWTGETVTGDN